MSNSSHKKTNCTSISILQVEKHFSMMDVLSNVKHKKMLRKYYYKVRSEANHEDLVIKRKDCKKTLQRKFNKYQNDFIAELRGLRTTDPKSNWSLLNKP
jgi:alpha-galactosidase/6-phospho-beta-glucosidase family protein